MNRFARIALPILLALPLDAADIHVPGDYPDVQAAIDASAPGDLIVVHGGTWGPITIDKPLQLLGDPAPLIVGAPPALLYSPWQSPITLSGPGSGAVILSNIETGGDASSALTGTASAGVSGGGFAELHVYDCAIRGTKWPAAIDPVYGSSGIGTSVPFVLIERSAVEASDSIDPGPWCGAEGVPGISASSSTVVVLDSTVKGGSAGPYHFPWYDCSGFYCCGGCGYGGAGIVCQELHHAGSTFVGGQGATWFAGEEICAVFPDGPPIVAEAELPLADDLAGSGAMELGGTFGLLWTTPGPSATLYWSFGVAPPVALGGLGLAYLDPGSLHLFGAVAAPGGLTFAIPPAPALLGREVALQLLDATSGLTRPVAGTLQP